MSLEDAGICPKGEIGPFFESTDTTYKGSFGIPACGNLQLPAETIKEALCKAWRTESSFEKFPGSSDDLKQKYNCDEWNLKF